MWKVEFGGLAVECPSWNVDSIHPLTEWLKSRFETPANTYVPVVDNPRRLW